MAESTKRCAVVTGANKGIGFAICKELASKGVKVVLTARDEKNGLEAINKLKESDQSAGFSGNVVFHQLDVTDPSSVASLAKFVKIWFGKLDILVNNAGVGGAILDADALRASGIGKTVVDWSKLSTETYELSEECLETNYYGAKRMVEAFLHLLQLSDAPRIVNISSTMGKLEFLPNGWAKEVLSNAESLTEERVDEVVKEFLKDFKEGSLQTKGWPATLSAYTVSKIALNSYTRVLASKHPQFCINCICPGFVKTDINCQTGFMTPEEGAQAPVQLALLPDGGPTGRFFVLTEESSFS